MFLLRHIFTRRGIIGVQRPVHWGNSELRRAASTQINQNVCVQKSYQKYFSSTNKDREHLNKDLKEASLTPTVLTSGQKLKKAVTEYGATVIVFHVGISLISLGSCYLLVSSGLDVEQLIVNLKLDNWIKGNTMLVSNAGTFAVAYAIHKVFAPVRITITLGSVPLIVKYLRNKGILKK